ncbi:hypothetical protein ACFONG_13875 [Uliginosibacterium paludis]|uniref:Uncharacterized protein n=1 Tax=Uliginosibacterium paludis TaxID=1615952 RepID=A0ABV2CPI9_9RHOO
MKSSEASTVPATGAVEEDAALLLDETALALLEARLDAAAELEDCVAVDERLEVLEATLDALDAVAIEDDEAATAGAAEEGVVTSPSPPPHADRSPSSKTETRAPALTGRVFFLDVCIECPWMT